MYEDYELEYEPSLADEIFNEASAKLMDALNGEVKQRLERIADENASLQALNNSLKKQLAEYKQREYELAEGERQLRLAAKKMPLKEFMGQYEVVMYQATMKHEYGPKCDKCDDKRQLYYRTPLGNDATEPCKCAKMFRVYRPQMQVLYSISKRNHKLLAWYRPYPHEDAFESGKLAEQFYNQDIEFADLDKHKAYFENESDCQAYCDEALGKQGSIS